MTAKTGQPGARQERAEIEKALYQNVLAVDIYQKKPYTMVLVLCSHDGEQYTELGFAKVNWPDKWDAEYGVSLAQHKAISEIAKRIQHADVEDAKAWTGTD